MQKPSVCFSLKMLTKCATIVMLQINQNEVPNTLFPYMVNITFFQEQRFLLGD